MSNRNRLTTMLAIMLLLLLSASVSAQELIEAPRPQPFFHNKLNRVLTVAEFGIRLNDDVATLSMCRYCYEKMLPESLAKSTTGMTVYSIGVAVGVTLTSRFLWNHNHRRLARIVLFADITQESILVTRNWYFRATATSTRKRRRTP